MGFRKMNDSKCIGIVGFGNMGKAAAQGFLKANYLVYGWNRTPSKVSSIKEVKPVSKLRDLPYLCKRIILFVSDDDASAYVLLSDEGLFSSNVKDLMIINSSTVSPIHSSIVSGEAKKRNIKYIHAPVMGGPKTLINRENLILVDGEKEIYKEAVDILNVISKNILYVGDPPKASVIKLILNSIAFVNTQVLSEALILSKAWDIDVDSLYEAASFTWLKPIFDKYKNRILDKEYPTSFSLKLAAKDLFYTYAAGYYKKKSLPIISTAVNSYLDAVDKGYGEKDYTRIYYYLLGKDH